VGGGVQAGSLCASATNWPILPPLGDYEDEELEWDRTQDYSVRAGKEISYLTQLWSAVGYYCWRNENLGQLDRAVRRLKRVVRGQ
jgi:hypothetical protein